MRLLYGTDHIFPSSAADTEQVIHTVAALGRRGVDVTLDIPRPAGAKSVDADDLRAYYDLEGPFGVVQRPAPLPRLPVAHKWIHARRVTAAHRPGDHDLLYTRNLWVLTYALRRGYTVAFEHFRPWPDQVPALRPILRWAMGHPRFVGALFHSTFARRAYERIGIDPRRLATAHNGFEPARFEPRLDARAARAAIGVEGDGPLVVYLGRLGTNKGLDVVLEMAGRCPGVRFLLVGSEGDGPVERAAARHGNVLVRPWQRTADVPAHLYAADVLIIPPSAAPLQRHGNTVLPIKLFSYLAAGRPILAPRAPDTAELLDDDDNSVLVPPGDAPAAAAALQALVDDEGRRQRLAASARALADTLTWDARAARVERFLRDRMP